MKKRTIFIFLLWMFCILILIFLFIRNVCGDQKSEKADTSGNGIIKDVIAFQCSYGDVTFTHKKHNVDYKIDCYDSKCHHTWDKEKQQKSGDLCSDCHKKPAEGNTPSKKDAFHKSCKTCHEDDKKANKPSGPTVCKDCHKKK